MQWSECDLHPKWFQCTWYRLLSVSMHCKIFWRHLFRINLSFVVTLQFSLWGKQGAHCSGFCCRILIVLFWLAEMFGWLAAQNLVLKTRNPLLPHTTCHTQSSWWSLIPGRGDKTVKQQLNSDKLKKYGTYVVTVGVCWMPVTSGRALAWPNNYDYCFC